MPKFAPKKKTSTPPTQPPLMHGFSQSDAAYQQVLAYLRKWLGKHPQFDYNMQDFHPAHILALLDDDGQLVAYCVLLPSVREACEFSKKHACLNVGLLEVLESHHNKGLGRRVLDQITIIARQGGYKYLRSFAIDGAAEFYHRYCFVTDLRIPCLNVRLTL
jgi:GNAT superfamily N-acetyltransferase